MARIISIMAPSGLCMAGPMLAAEAAAVLLLALADVDDSIPAEEVTVCTVASEV